MARYDKIPSTGEKLFAVGALFCYTGSIQRLFIQNELITSNDGNPAFQILWLFIIGFTILLVITRANSFIVNIQSNKSLNILIIYLISSIIWSQVPLISLRKVTGILGPSLFAIYVASRFDREEILNLCSQALGISALASLAIGIISPELGIMHEEAKELSNSWRGVFTHKNSLGQMMLGNLIINISLYKHNSKFIYKLGIAISCLLIILSRSTTSISLALAIFIISYIYNFNQLKSSVKATIILFILIVCSVIIVIIANDEQIAKEIIGKDLTFTGRDQLWKLVIPNVNNHLMLGNGYGGFWLGEFGESGGINTQLELLYDNAHNGYLDICLDLGIVGLLLFLGVYIPLFVKSFIQYILKNNQAYFFVFTLLFIQIIYNFFESNFIKPNNIFWVFLIVNIVSDKIVFVKLKIENSTLSKRRLFKQTEINY